MQSRTKFNIITAILAAIIYLIFFSFYNFGILTPQLAAKSILTATVVFLLISAFYQNGFLLGCAVIFGLMAMPVIIRTWPLNDELFYAIITLAIAIGIKIRSPWPILLLISPIPITFFSTHSLLYTLFIMNFIVHIGSLVYLVMYRPLVRPWIEAILIFISGLILSGMSFGIWSNFVKHLLSEQSKTINILISIKIYPAAIVVLTLLMALIFITEFLICSWIVEKNKENAYPIDLTRVALLLLTLVIILNGIRSYIHSGNQKIKNIVFVREDKNE